LDGLIQGLGEEDGNSYHLVHRLDKETSGTMIVARNKISAQKLGQQFSALAHNHVRLAALETRQAGEGLVKIMMIGFFTACLLFSAWLSLLGALVIVVIENNIVSNINTFLLLALLHCVIVLTLIKIIRHQSHLLMFSATVNSLAPTTPAKPVEK
jgi:uncharacterized membrane protein YqjE